MALFQNSYLESTVSYTSMFQGSVKRQDTVIWFKNFCLSKQLNDLEILPQKSVGQSGQGHNLRAVESSFKYYFRKQKKDTD